MFFLSLLHNASPDVGFLCVAAPHALMACENTTRSHFTARLLGIQAVNPHLGGTRSPCKPCSNFRHAQVQIGINTSSSQDPRADPYTLLFSTRGPLPFAHSLSPVTAHSPAFPPSFLSHITFQLKRSNFDDAVQTSMKPFAPFGPRFSSNCFGRLMIYSRCDPSKGFAASCQRSLLPLKLFSHDMVEISLNHGTHTFR